ncbi:MAG: hypothetical protein J3R72DRAFT_202615 [Linnemannia gamsii]|nr:MAG: hypothetical protein J3R72DRAFT_202615 [Linnemannia gamsii]
MLQCSSKIEALSSDDLSTEVISSAYSSQNPMRGHHDTYCTTKVNPPVGEAENNTHKGYSSDSEIFPTESRPTTNHATTDADRIPSPPEAQTAERHQLMNKVPAFSSGVVSPTAATAQVLPAHSTVVYLPHNIFLADTRAPTIRSVMPANHCTDFESTVQLAFCASLLPKNTSSLLFGSGAAGVPSLDTVESAWLSAMREDPPAQAHIRWLISKLVAEFVKDASMGSAAISEVVILGPVLCQRDYRLLLSCLIERFNLAALLNVDLLQGLVQLVQCASTDYLTEDDMVRIIMSVQRRFESTQASSKEHVYQLVFTISKILEVMITGDVKKQSRQWDHQSFLEVLHGIGGGGDDTLLKFQVDYAYQSLLFLLDDETSWQALLRNAQSAAIGVSAVGCVFKLDPINVLAAAEHLQQVAGHAIDVVKPNIDAAPACQAIAQGGSQAAESMPPKKEAWFLILQAAHVLIREGRLVEFNSLICEAPCRFEANFQYGICLILGEIIVSQLWDFDSKVSAIDFLRELYNVEAGQKKNVKIQMLVASVLNQISKMSLPGVSMHAGVRLGNLQENQFTDTEDCHLVQTRLLLPTEFLLLGRVLDITHIEYDLDCMMFRRLGEGSCPIFTPLRAKTSLDPNNSFLLMERVKSFLESDRRVFLLLGDSGSGKSMFCRQLERELWNDYKVGSRIPLFVNLPFIDQPERNLIEEHLCRHNNISADRVQEIKGRQLVLICDSYDEARLITNLYTTNRLSELEVKMVISCRNTFLGRGYDGWFRPYEAGRFYDMSSDLFEEATILPFTDSDITDYITRFVLDPAAAGFLGNIPVLSQESYLERLSVIPHLMDLAKNPFLLTLALKALPSLPTDALDSSDLEVLQVGLYHGFIHEWIRFSKERLHRVCLSQEVQGGFDELLQADFCWCTKDYSKRLAEAIHLHQRGRPVVNYTHLKDKKTWKAEFFGRGIKRTLLREASPLTRAGVEHWFIHKSLLDYFVSLKIYDPDDYSQEDYGDDGGDDFGHGGGDNHGGGGSARHDGRSNGLGDDGGEPAHGFGGSSGGNNGTSESSGSSSGGSGGPSGGGGGSSGGGGGSSGGGGGSSGGGGGSSGGGGGSSGGSDGSSGGNHNLLGGRKRSHSESGGSDAGKDGFNGNEDDPRRRKEDFRPKKKARMDGSRASDSSGLISKLNLFKEPAVMWFLVVRARTDVRFKKILLSTIEQSKSSVGPSLAAANAIIILFKTGERFQHVDMNGVRVPSDYMSEETSGYVPFAGGSLTGIELMDALIALQTSLSISKESARSETIPTTLLTPWSSIIDGTSAPISLRDAPLLYPLEDKDKVEMTSEGQHDTVKKYQQYQQVQQQHQQQLGNGQRWTSRGQQTETVQSSVRAWFDAADTDHSGTLSCEELQRALMNGDWTPLNVETVRVMMEMFDGDNDGTISFNEFKGLWNHIEKWKHCFQPYDHDSSGTIDAMEFQKALQGFSYNLSKIPKKELLYQSDSPASAAPSSTSPTLQPQAKRIQNVGSKTMLSSKSKRQFPSSGPASPNTDQPEAAHAEDSSSPLKKKARETMLSAFSGKQEETGIGAIDATIPTIEEELIRLKDHRLEEQDSALYIPLLAMPSLQSSKETLFPLMERTIEFLSGPGLVFLLLGDSGGGKSTFNLQLERTLWKNYKRGDPIPLRINLPSIDNPQQDIIGEQLRRLDFSATQFMELKQNRQFIVICDGYDESQLTTNLYTTNAFNQPGQWNIKMVVTCRTQCLGSDYHRRFLPQRICRYDPPAPYLFQEAVIAPFTQEQIQRYVDIYVPLEPRTWRTQDYMDRLTNIPTLLDMVRNPFLLTLALETLPGVTEGKKDLSKIKISRVQLYDAFVTHWLNVSKQRLESNTLSVHDRDDFGQLLDAGFISMGLDYSMKLALAIFDEQDGNPVVQYVQVRDLSTWRAEFFGPQTEIRLLRESSPLTRTGNEFRFIHRSMLEYFLTRAIYSPVRMDKQEFDEQADPVSPVAPSIDTNGPLFRRNLIQETSIIQFLCDRVKSNPDFEQQLRSIVDLSKTDASAIIAATNAITILVKAGVNFNSVDLRGVKIPGADLSDGQFDSAQFQGADLRDVNLSKSWLRQADLSGSQLEGAQFGELPYLEMGDVVNACLYSPDGRMLAVALRNQGFGIYDTSTWTLIHRSISAGRLTDVAFSPNNQQIVLAGRDGSVLLWDFVIDEERLSMIGHTGDVNSVVFSPCGDQVASASDDSTVRLWDSRTGIRILVLLGHNWDVLSVKFSPDGCQLVSGGRDQTIRFWDAQTGAPGAVLSPLLGIVISLAYSPDGRWVASGHNKNILQLWNAATKKPGPIMRGPASSVTGIAFSPNGQWIASSSDDETVRLWDAPTGASVSVLTGHGEFVHCVSFSPNGHQIASGGEDSKVRLWEVSSTWSSPDLPDSGPVRKLEYALDGLTILAYGYGVFRKLDARTGASESIPFESPKQKSASCIASTLDDRQFAVGFEDGSINLWNRQTDTAGPVLEGHSSKVSLLVYSPCHRWIASVADDNTVRLWDLHDTQQHRVLVEAEGGLVGEFRAVAFSPAGDQLTVGAACGTIRLFDLPTAELLTCNNPPGSYIISMVYSPNGQQIATGNENGCIHLWDLYSEEPIAILEAHNGWVQCIAYSPCGQWIASGSDDKTVGIWYRQLSGEVESWSKIHSICSFSAWIESVAWNPVIPMELVTSCNGGSVQVWRMTHDDGGNVVVKMLWGSNIGALHAESLVLEDTIGLSPVNQKLLIQRGAISHSAMLEEQE